MELIRIPSDKLFSASEALEASKVNQKEAEEENRKLVIFNINSACMAGYTNTQIDINLLSTEFSKELENLGYTIIAETVLDTTSALMSRVYKISWEKPHKNIREKNDV